MDMATAAVQLLMKLTEVKCRSAIKPHVLTALAAEVAVHDVDTVVGWIMDDPGLLLMPSCRWGVYRIGVSSFGHDPPYLKPPRYRYPISSKHLRRAIREDGLSIGVMKEGNRYIWLWGSHSLCSGARTLHSFDLATWVLEARKAENILRDVAWDYRIGQEPANWTH